MSYTCSCGRSLENDNWKIARHNTSKFHKNFLENGVTKEINAILQKEKKKVQRRNDYLKNIDKAKEYSKNYYAQNKEKMNQLNRNNYLKNKEKKMIA